MIVLVHGTTVRYLFFHLPVGVKAWTMPFYNPESFSLSAVSAGTSMAVLTCFGFDSISTFSEEVHNPRRNIQLASGLFNYRCYGFRSG